MSRFAESIGSLVSLKLGEKWTVETIDGNALFATHDNRSRTRVHLNGFDKRRTATTEEADECVEQMRRFLAGEVHKYTAEWAEKGSQALADWPGQDATTAGCTR